MGYIQGYGQQWTTNGSGGLTPYSAGGSNSTSPMGGNLNSSPPQGAQFVATGSDQQGNQVPDYQAPQAPSQSPAPAGSNFGGLAATPGGQMTFNGQQYVANNGQWTPAQAGSTTGSQQPGYAPPSWLPQQGIQGQAGGQDMLGQYTLNNRNFATLEQANALAKQLGGNVVSTNYEDGPGGRTPEYNIDMGRGSPLNAGQLAYYFGPTSSFAGIRDPQQRYDAIMRSIEDELRYNDSPMERQVADKRDLFSSFKDTPGGFSSGVRTGAGAPSLGNSFWADSQGGSMPWQSQASPQLPPGLAGGLPGAPGTAGGQGGGNANTPYPFRGDTFGGGQQSQNQQLGSLLPLLQMLGLGGGNNLSSFANFLNGGGADFGAQTAGSRGFQRKPFLPGYGGGLGYGARFSNAGYYPQFGM